MTSVLPEIECGPLQAFYEREERHAGDVCFVQPGPDGQLESLTWHDVGQQARRIASYLDSLNLEPGSRVALMSSNCCHWIIADIAIWMAGHISVPLYPILAEDTVRKVLEHSDAQVMFVGKLQDWDTIRAGIPDQVALVSLPLAPPAIAAGTVRWGDILREQLPMPGTPDQPLNALATIIYTSGTTGMPKGVMHSFANLATVGQLTGQLYDTREADRMLSYLPLAHVAERAAVEINQLYNGFRVYFSHSLDTFADDLRRARPTLFFAVPRIWSKLQQRVLEQMPEKKLERLLRLPIVGGMVRRKLTGALGMDKLRIAVSGAAPLSTSLMRWYSKLGIEILEGYAMSENFAYSHSTQLGQARIGYVGNANPHVICKLSPEGEILVKSPTNMLGYYREPELSAQAIDTDGYLHTGDKGEISRDGRLKITGRIKDIFKTSKGKYVAPAPIEDRLQRHTALELVCVTGANLPQPIALATLAEGTRHDEQALQLELADLLEETNSALDKHEHLSQIIVFPTPWTVESNIVTPTLKIKRPEIDKRYMPRVAEWQSSKDRVIFAQH
ncbi:AMP-binding protein [Parahaliea mediterranea]|uniref:AMP-binding protein n=1 Tax=Parahaliea mediterranea TaxID=651086 RepID=A0A939IMF6_9GAMM|nr:AMP-binding protein [Parahaliea mediterranea]MBN7796983.1 AMP-binding protein [Parahaliea mediterranea]